VEATTDARKGKAATAATGDLWLSHGEARSRAAGSVPVAEPGAGGAGRADASADSVPLLRRSWRTYLALTPAAILLLVITLIGLGLRLYCLDCLSLWKDEIDSIGTPLLGIPAIFNYRFGLLGNQTPLYYLLVWLSLQPADPAVTAFWVRLPSAVAGALTVPAIYLLGRELFSRPVGLVAAMLAALSTPLLAFSQEVRPYAFLALLTVVSVYCLLVAERTGRARWWAAFALAMSLDLLLGYIVYTLVLPGLAPLFLWVAARLRRRWPTDRRAVYAAAMALIGIGLIAAPGLLALSGVRKAAPDLTKFSRMLLFALVELFDWLGQGGIDRGLKFVLQAALLWAALAGALWAVRRDRHGRPAALICGSVVVIPVALVAALSTTNPLASRYLLISLPFFLLLVARGVVEVFMKLGGAAPGRTARLLWAVPAGALALALLSFPAGALAYDRNSAYGYGDQQDKLDYRAVATYLAARAAPADTVVIADEWPFGIAVCPFYWHQRPPAHVYDARDPRLGRYVPQGDVYWVLTFAGNAPEMLDRLVASEPAWELVQRFGALALVRERGGGPAQTMAARLQRLVGREAALRPSDPFVEVLRGSLAQAQGDALAAVTAYRAAGIIYPNGEEQQRTAAGWQALGERSRAWAEAILGKTTQPGRPEIHRWIAEELRAEGFTDEARVALAIAGGLGATH
jgi:4-amino-4-deoxy-L-arabinose transferase-like glycosyltransferase